MTGAAAWKRGERQRLRQIREQLPAAFCAAADARIAALLDKALPQLASTSFAFYLPFPGEPDLRPAAREWIAAGGRASLPETVPRQPLVFRPWTADSAMRAGIWNIPVPDTNAEARPEILLIPCLGYDRNGYRLGHGGGFYDRTLAALTPKPLAVGIAYRHALLPSIRPEAHDIPMDMIVTDRAVVWHSQAFEQTIR